MPGPHYQESHGRQYDRSVVRSGPVVEGPCDPTGDPCLESL